MKSPVCRQQTRGRSNALASVITESFEVILHWSKNTAECQNCRIIVTWHKQPQTNADKTLAISQVYYINAKCTNRAAKHDHQLEV